MKIGINFGFVLIIGIIIGITFLALTEMNTGESVTDNFSFGFLTGILLSAGIFMLNHGFRYDTKTKQWEEY